MSLISVELIPEEKRRGFPKEIPAMLIGRLAVDKSIQRKRIGRKLLRHAFECAIEISDKTAIWAVYIDAIDEKAKSYYLKLGFIPFEDNFRKLFLRLKTIEQAMKQSSRK